MIGTGSSQIIMIIRTRSRIIDSYKYSKYSTYNDIINNSSISCSKSSSRSGAVVVIISISRSCSSSSSNSGNKCDSLQKRHCAGLGSAPTASAFFLCLFRFPPM